MPRFISVSQENRSNPPKSFYNKRIYKNHYYHEKVFSPDHGYQGVEDNIEEIRRSINAIPIKAVLKLFQVSC
jgi:hypothetical protein